MSSSADVKNKGQTNDLPFINLYEVTNFLRIEPGYIDAQHLLVHL